MNFKIKTNRLSLCQIRDDHKDYTIAYLGHAEHAQYLPLERPYTLDEATKWSNDRLEHWQKHNFGTFIIYLQQPVELIIGYCGIEHVRDTPLIDIRYGISKEFWGHGYAHEAALAVLRFGFKTLGLEKLYGAAVPGNIPSLRLLNKLGMEKDNSFDIYGEELNHYSVTVEQFNTILTEEAG